MSKTLHQFGRVLFDELEQVAVRRGGFASLEWVNEKLIRAQRSVEALGKKAAECNDDLPSLRKQADECTGRHGTRLRLQPRQPRQSKNSVRSWAT